jgi:hypothetical protein
VWPHARAASLLLSESGSLERRDSGPRDCPCFVNAAVTGYVRLSRIAQVGARLHRRRPPRPVPMQSPVPGELGGASAFSPMQLSDEPADDCPYSREAEARCLALTGARMGVGSV